jgi:hypothetical protein
LLFVQTGEVRSPGFLVYVAANFLRGGDVAGPAAELHVSVSKSESDFF